MKRGIERAVVCIVGLGYVGLPLATAFSRKLRVIGFDIDTDKVNQFNQSHRALTGRQKLQSRLTLTTDPKEIGKADFVIICVPTPVTSSKEPDLSYVRRVAETVGKNMKRGSVVILESTVYPGVTEEIVKPILEKSGFKCGKDFRLAYSPERINPGDEEHTVDKITKVVAGMDEETTEIVAELYSQITPLIFKAKDIRTAEAAKVIENIQRDLNIALTNELSLIFNKMGLSTKDVLATAATKWNFHRYFPGLVGGHCIPVVPYYLVHKAKELGHHPQVILAGRAINDYMPKYVAQMAIRALNEVGKTIRGSKVLVLGLTYKEDVPDIRESPAKEMIKELKGYKVRVFGLDPLLKTTDMESTFETPSFQSLEKIKRDKFDCIILAVAHSYFRRLSLANLKEMQSANPILIDVRGVFDAEEAKRAGFYYATL